MKKLCVFFALTSSLVAGELSGFINCDGKTVSLNPVGNVTVLLASSQPRG